MDFVEILEHHLLDHKLAKLFTIGHTTFYLNRLKYQYFYIILYYLY